MKKTGGSSRKILSKKSVKSIVQRTQGKQLERTKQKKRLTKEEMNLREQVKVLYSSEDILVFHKPAGMLSQRAKADDDSLKDSPFPYF